MPTICKNHCIFRILFFSTILNLFFFQKTFAQISQGGLPTSFIAANMLIAERTINANTVVLPALDMKRIEEEDAKAINNIRFATSIATNLTFNNAGTWFTLPNGDRIWKLTIRSNTALALGFVYKDFFLPEGAKLFMYSQDAKQILGAYTNANNDDNHTFITGLVYDEAATLEYYEPKNVAGLGRFIISEVLHAYNKQNLFPSDGIAQRDTTTSIKQDAQGSKYGFGGARTCENNINCQQSAGIQTIKRGVVRIMLKFKEGAAYCSGSLINNTANDGKPYLLTAFHCQDGYTPDYDNFVFYFNYESPDCTNPTIEPALQSIRGCVRRSGFQDSDFLLLEIKSSVPTSYNPYFNGWNKQTTLAAQNAVSIHHPAGDIKKISYDTNNTLGVKIGTIAWAKNNISLPPVISPSNSHWRVVFSNGITEIGSSGAPLFDSNGLMLGQLHGGTIDSANCKVVELFFGRIANSWEGGFTTDTRLRDWLDPLNSGVDTYGGGELATSATNINISGKVLAYPNNTPVNSLKIYFAYTANGISKADSVTTDIAGAYKFSVPNGASVSWLPVKDYNPSNGVSATDIVSIRKHLLAIETFTSPYQHIAADVNNSKSLSASDIVQMRQLLLGIIPKFDNTSWKFVPKDNVFLDPNNPFATDIPDGYRIAVITKDTANSDFIAIKIGDLNGNAETDK